MKKIYSISDIAKKWKVTRQRAWQLVVYHKIPADITAHGRLYWYTLPAKPEKIPPGRKSLRGHKE